MDYKPYGCYAAVYFHVIDGLGGSPATINVYDCNSSFLAATNVFLPGPTNPMEVGVVIPASTRNIGMIEIVCPSGELLTHVELYIPEPATVGLLGLGVLMLVRRR